MYMRKEKIYISGPVTSIGIVEARRRFGEAEGELQKLGYRTCNPTKMRLPVWLALHFGKAGYRWCVALQLAWLAMTCDSIYLLDGWHLSDGARAERSLARVFGLSAIYEKKLKRK